MTSAAGMVGGCGFGFAHFQEVLILQGFLELREHWRRESNWDRTFSAQSIVAASNKSNRSSGRIRQHTRGTQPTRLGQAALGLRWPPASLPLLSGNLSLRPTRDKIIRGMSAKTGAMYALATWNELCRSRIGCHTLLFATKMPLTNLERDFLQRLSAEAWNSPPLFDHGLVAKLIDTGYVRATLLGGGRIQYELTKRGRSALKE